MYLEIFKYSISSSSKSLFMHLQTWITECGSVYKIINLLWIILPIKPIQELKEASQGVNSGWSQYIKHHHVQRHDMSRKQVKYVTFPMLSHMWTTDIKIDPESSFQMKVNLEIKIQKPKGRVEFLEVQYEVFSQRKFGCHVICWFWCIVFYQIQSQFKCLPGNVRVLYGSTYRQALWRWWVPFPVGLDTCTVSKFLVIGLLIVVLLCLFSQLTCLTQTPQILSGAFSRRRLNKSLLSKQLGLP